MNRILCPSHQERTPSCMVYSDHVHCFACGFHASLESLNGIEIPKVEDPEPEDLGLAMSYIESLPLREVRGLMLPADDYAYYIPWPTGDYYKKRFFRPSKIKYIGAAGHKKPLFMARMRGNATLVIVEGEINALSIAAACPDLDVVSPGGCGDFTINRNKKYCTLYSAYERILIIADGDEPGAIAVIDLMGLLSGKVKNLSYALMAPDANDVLVGQGSEELRKQIQGFLGRNLEKGA